MIGDGATRVFAAVLEVYARDGRATVRSVAREAGVSKSTAHHHLRRLHAEGLVSYTPGCQGTLRPLYGPVSR